MKKTTAHGSVVKVAVGCVRVSTFEQASEGVSLDAQGDKLCSYCKFNGINLIDIVADERLSGSTLDRPGLRSRCGNRTVIRYCQAAVDVRLRAGRGLSVSARSFRMSASAELMASALPNCS